MRGLIILFIVRILVIYMESYGKPFIARNCIRRRNFVKSVIRIERNIERKKYGGSYSDIVAWKVY